eukprot:4634268-Prymnesium_polylepis.1
MLGFARRPSFFLLVLNFICFCRLYDYHDRNRLYGFTIKQYPDSPAHVDDPMTASAGLSSIYMYGYGHAHVPNGQQSQTSPLDAIDAFVPCR